MDKSGPLASERGARAEAADEAATRTTKARRLAFNAAAGGAANILKVLIQLAVLPMMAHLLGPAEFGIYALALPTISFFMVLADGGLGSSLAREDESSTLVWSTAFWALLLSGIGLAIAVSGWGVLLSILSHEPRLRGLMAFLSISFVFITQSVLPMARLTRVGRVAVFAGADLSSSLIGALIAVVMASRGAGAWSLAAQYVTGYLIRGIILNAAAFSLPRREFDLATLRPHLSMGGAILGGRLSDFLGRMVENLVYGGTFGAAALGAYSFSNQASRFLCEAAANPLWVTLYSHALRECPEQTTKLYLRLVRLLATILFPMAFLVSASAPDLLHPLLGDKWASAPALLRILLPVQALVTVALLGSARLLAQSRSLALFSLLATLSFGRVAAVIAGVWTGAVGALCGVALVHLIVSLIAFASMSARGGPNHRDLRASLAPPILAGAAGGLAYALLSSTQPPGLLWTSICLVIGGGVALAFLCLLGGEQLRTDLALLQTMLRRRRGVQNAL